MKSVFKKAMTAVVVLAIFFAGEAVASDHVMGARPGQCAPPPPPNGGIHLLVKYEMDNMAVNVIAELTGKTVETIREELEAADMRTFLKNNDVDEALFRAGMKENMTALVNEALANGRITQAQADEIIEKMDTQTDAQETARP